MKGLPQMHRRLSLAALLLMTSAPALAQQRSTPQPQPIVDTIPQARDIAYPGTMELDVDATDVQRGIFRVKQAIPVAKSGHMVLLFPEWLPGNHAPRGQIEKLAGLRIRAGGKVIPWRRDPVDVYAFHVQVPQGARRLEVEFQFLSATAANQGRIVMAPNMLNLQWNSVSLYPAGYYVRRIPVQATVKYPEGWKAASGLPARAVGSTYSYQKTDYETLVDSPVFAGRYYREWALSPKVDLNVFADNPKELEAKPEQIEAHRRLIDQVVKLYGAEHYDRYEFLLAITEEMGTIGVEHHRSSENGVGPGYFTDWNAEPHERDLLPHEFNHSWNGKYRRGADMITPDYRTPTRNSLLWVYEGQDQFWGYVLAARAGLMSKQDALDAIAVAAASLDARPAREWRPLVDTTLDPIISARRPKAWLSWQRSEDYYTEGMLIWYEVDAILRARSGGTRSLDDFARAFFGMNDGDWGVLPYDLSDVVRTLNAIQPYDWARLFDERVNKVSERAPLNGFEGNGYRLVYTDEPTKVFNAGGVTNLAYSGGLAVGRDGAVVSVIWDSPAFDAGLDLGDQIVAVNGTAYSGDALKDAIRAAKGAREPVKLLVKSGKRYREVALDYHGGLRYPRFEKTAAGEAGLDKLLQPR
jgi:predicted metalloprotease with PDZ domain